MARVTTSGGWSQANDASFRLWLAECEQMLQDCGLVRTADTGQIDPATATIPVANTTYAGYSVWRFDDSLQATAPVFLKCSYGRSNAAASVMFGLQVGTGSDGAGNLTGTTTSDLRNTVNGAIGTTGSGVYTSYAIHREGFAALFFKAEGGGTTTMSPIAFAIQRTVDNTGEPTADGLIVMRPYTQLNLNNDAVHVRLRFLPTIENSGTISSLTLGIVPGAITDSRVGLSPQVFPQWTMLPKQRPLMFTAASILDEVGAGAQFEMTIVGSAPRNYICVGNCFGRVLYGNPAVNCDIIILWED